MELLKTIPRLKPRPAQAHKGDFGRVLIIAGSVGMSGAAALAGRAALRAGAGLVRVATAKSALPIVASIEPCYTTIHLDEDSSGKISSKALNTILDAVSDNDVAAFGPGVGVTTELQSVIQALIEQRDINLIVDGDGLNNLSKIKDWPGRLNARLILTPHPGEMKRLWRGLFRDPLPDDRQEQAILFARQSNAIMVLKGAGTIVTDGQKTYINTTGNPGMATAGSGDVLTGIIAGLWGQAMDSLDAAVLGVYTHGLAGDIAAQKLGQVSLMATDIIDALSDAFINVQKV